MPSIDPNLPLDPAIAGVEGRKCIRRHSAYWDTSPPHPDAHPVLRAEYERGELVHYNNVWLYVPWKRP